MEEKDYNDRLKSVYSDLTTKRKISYIKYNFENKISKYTNPRVLEIGPGRGEFIEYLKEKGISDIDVMDNDLGVLKYIKNKFRINKAHLEKNILKSKLGKYDIIIMVQVLEHIDIGIQAALLKKLFLSLAKGGVLFIVVPNAGNPLGIVERYGDIQHTTSYTEQSLKDLVISSKIKGFKLSLRGFDIPLDGPVNLLRKILQKILHLFLLSLMIINGGTYFKILTPNIIMEITKTKS